MPAAPGNHSRVRTEIIMLWNHVDPHLSSLPFRDRYETVKHLFTFSFQKLIKYLQGQPPQDGNRGPVFKINLGF